MKVYFSAFMNLPEGPGEFVIVHLGPIFPLAPAPRKVFRVAHGELALAVVPRDARCVLRVRK